MKKAMQNTKVTEPTFCSGCDEKITVSVHEVLHFDSIECPRCGTDTYHEEWQYEEALNLAEELLERTKTGNC